MPRLLSLTTLSLLAATTAAFAEAPGETAPVAPVAEQPSATRVAPMAHRFSVSLGLGGMNVAPDGNPDAKTDFGIGQLALRYRMTRHLELELAFAGGRQTVDGEEGELAVGTASIGLRYRFAPERRWNWFVAAGVGAASIAAHDASDEELDQASRPAAHLGIGVERRFRRFAVEAQLRFIGMGPTFAESMRDTPVMATTPAAEPPTATTPTPGGLGGGLFTIGGSYYF